MNPLLEGMLLSLLPVSELRGGIPYAIAQGINPIIAFVFCTLANIFIAPIGFIFLDTLHKLLFKLKFYRKTFKWYVNRIRKRKKRVEKAYETYGIIALTIFVATPLPLTGAWTGTLIAWLLGLKRVRSLFAISLGVILSGIVVTLIVTGTLIILKFLI